VATIGADDEQLGNNPTDGHLRFPSEVAEKSCHKSMGKNLRKAPSVSPLDEHTQRRYFSLGTARQAGSHARTNLGRLRDCEGDHFQPHNRQRFASRSLAKTALFSVESRQSQRIPELVDSAQLTQTSALTGFRPVPRVRILPAPPRSLGCRETAPPVAMKYAKHAHFSRYLLDNLDWRERTARRRRAHYPGFSLEGTRAVRFQ
jgi:hypothetical protein